MLKFSERQFHQLTLGRRSALLTDVFMHLAQYRPGLVAAYARPYLRWAIDDSIELAQPFELNDVRAMRLFVCLRWDIAPAYFEQPQIAAVLMQTHRPAMQRFETLSTAAYSAAWEDARRLSGPDHWRSRFWYAEDAAAPGLRTHDREIPGSARRAAQEKRLGHDAARGRAHGRARQGLADHRRDRHLRPDAGQRRGRPRDRTGPRRSAGRLPVGRQHGALPWRRHRQALEDCEASGTGAFTFASPKLLPDGTLVREIEFVGGTPNFEKYIVGEKHALWEVTGDATKDEKSLIAMMRTERPGWTPPAKADHVLHHFEDGAVGYIPRAIHDTRLGGVSHTGSNSMINNSLF